MPLENSAFIEPGPIGPQGPAGDSGTAGATGATGPAGSAGVGRVREQWSTTVSTSSGSFNIVPTSCAMTAGVGSTVYGKAITFTHRPVRWALRQTVGVGTGVIRYELYSGPSSATGCYFEVNLTSAYQRGTFTGTFDFVPASNHELILKTALMSGTSSSAATRVCIAIEFEEIE